jgi:hypothetical protein
LDWATEKSGYQNSRPKLSHIVLKKLDDCFEEEDEEDDETMDLNIELSATIDSDEKEGTSTFVTLSPGSDCYYGDLRRIFLGPEDIDKLIEWAIPIVLSKEDFPI